MIFRFLFLTTTTNCKLEQLGELGLSFYVFFFDAKDGSFTFIKIQIKYKHRKKTQIGWCASPSYFDIKKFPHLAIFAIMILKFEMNSIQYIKNSSRFLDRVKLIIYSSYFEMNYLRAKTSAVCIIVYHVFFCFPKKSYLWKSFYKIFQPLILMHCSFSE